MRSRRWTASPPAGFPVVIVDQLQGGGGYHLDDHGQSYALVKYSASWSLAASHEAIEMLCTRSASAPARSLPEARPGPGRVPGRGMRPLRGRRVCLRRSTACWCRDFITPHFYDPQRTSGALFVQRRGQGAAPDPAGGYISWWDPQSNHIWQELWWRPQKEFKDLGEGSFEQSRSHCLHNTGEGGLAPVHRHGGELIFQIGTGYFGCRDADGRFSMDRLQQRVAEAPVRAIEIKLSQGAEPGLGGMLPAGKVSEEIAAIRGVPVGTDCVSPARHTAFSVSTASSTSSSG
jgi:hypothetical protein